MILSNFLFLTSFLVTIVSVVTLQHLVIILLSCFFVSQSVRCILFPLPVTLSFVRIHLPHLFRSSRPFNNYLSALPLAGDTVRSSILIFLPGPLIGYPNLPSLRWRCVRHSSSTSPISYFRLPPPSSSFLFVCPFTSTPATVRSSDFYFLPTSPSFVFPF